MATVLPAVEQPAHGKAPACLPPWRENPHRLVSLWDMIQILASDLASIWPVLDNMGLGFVMDGDHAITEFEIENNFGIIADLFNRLGWIDLAAQARRIHERAKAGERGDVMHALLDDMKEAFRHKTSRVRVLLPVDKDAELLDGATRRLAGEDAELLGQPAQEFDLAGRCLALGLPTASVSHAMRAVESSLHLLAGHLGIKFPGSEPELQDWKVLTDKIKSEIDKLNNQSRSPQKNNALEKLGKLMVSADGFRIAWRNHVQHARAHYIEHEARTVLVHVAPYLTELGKHAKGPIVP